MSDNNRIKEMPRFFRLNRWIFYALFFFIFIQILLALFLAISFNDDDYLSKSSDKKSQKESFDPNQVSRASSQSNKLSNSSHDLSEYVQNCTLSSKDTISALKRARTSECKIKIAGAACANAQNELYPLSLPRFCNLSGLKFGKNLGCFRDQKSSRILPHYSEVESQKNSVIYCLNKCLQSGFPYAGLEYGVECFCGNNSPPPKALIKNSFCNMSCPSKDNFSKDSTCGGYFAIQVYETGVFRDQEGVKEIVDYRPFMDKNKIFELEKRRVRIVFFLTLNGRALRQVLRLIKALFHERHYFLIHVDARQDYLFRELLSLSYKFPSNFKMIRERESTIWGGASLLKVLLKGMRILIEMKNNSEWDWDYVLNLSESDYPLKTTEELELFLSLNQGGNFLKSHGREVQNFILKQGLDKIFVECELRMWRVGDRVLPSRVLIDGGSDWIVVHYDFVKYLIESGDELVTGFKKLYEMTLLPAESFFHNVLRNSALCGSFIDNNLHVTNWKRKLGCKCQYKNIVDWCGCSPNDFRISDFNRLQLTGSRYLFFARKFEAIVSQGIINKLETFLFPHREEINSATFDRYWQSIYHHADILPGAPDDKILTLSSSLSRISSNFTLKSLKVDHFQNNFENLSIIELSTLVQNDAKRSLIIHFTLSNFSQFTLETIEIQAQFKQNYFITYEKNNEKISDFFSKVVHMSVGSEYDAKEQIFRNLGGVLGPLSEPVLSYHVSSQISLNISFAWMSPNGILQAHQNYTVDKGDTANFVKPSLKIPLLVGNWTVKLLTPSGHLFASTSFLVSPSEFYNGKIPTDEQRSVLNGEFSEHFDLQKKIDEGFSQFYEMEDVCSVRRSSFLKNLKICAGTVWSTIYPDPKSKIDGIDPHTGYLVP